MVASLLAIHCDLGWADNQYMSTLVDVISEYHALFNKPEKKKVDSQSIKKFIRKE